MANAEKKATTYITTIKLTEEDKKFWERSRLNRSAIWGDFTKLIRIGGEALIIDLLDYLEKHNDDGVLKLRKFMMEAEHA